MSIKVLAYNTLDGFGKPDRVDALLAFIESESPDLAFFSEAYESSANVEVALRGLNDLGYQVVTEPYSDSDHRLDKHHFIGISRLPGDFSSTRYATRNGWIGRTSVSGTTLTVIGLHANDRHEVGRLEQAKSIPAVKGATIMMGDLNAMHGDTIVARVSRVVKPITRFLPSIEPAEMNVKQPIVPRTGNLAQRFTGMANGSMLRYLEGRGLVDIDSTRQPTIHGIAQLDHFLVSREVTLESFKVHTNVSLSDHKPITTTISVS